MKTSNTRTLALTAALSMGWMASNFAQTPAAQAKLSDLSFIEGHWQGTAFGGPIEALWSAPTGDNMLGSMRMMKDDKVNLYEILVIEQTPQGPMILVKHFKPGLIGQEEKDKPDRYALIELGKERAVFEKVGEPTRVIYEKRPNQVLAVVLGKQREGQWNWNDLFVFKPVR